MLHTRKQFYQCVTKRSLIVDDEYTGLHHGSSTMGMLLYAILRCKTFAGDHPYSAMLKTIRSFFESLWTAGVVIEYTDVVRACGAC